VYRFWRDLGYTVGALAAGVLSQAIGMAGAIAGIGLLTAVSGFAVALLMHEKD
jgi:hypothetical protein